MLPNMPELLRKFQYMFPDALTAQELGTGTMSGSGAVIPGSWADVPGLEGMPGLIEPLGVSGRDGGEVLSPVGQEGESLFQILFDRVRDEIHERQRLVDQDGRIYEIKQIVRDSHHVATVVRAVEFKG